MKRILIFSIAYQPFWGGAEVAVKEVTDRLPNFQFDMITLRFKCELPGFERIGNVNVYRVGLTNKYLFIFQAVKKALELNKKNSYDIVWSIMASYSGFAALFFKILRPRVKFVLTLQEGDPFSHIKGRVGLLYPLFKLIFKKADVVTAISNYLADWARQMGSKNVVVIPNGIDISKF